MGKVKDETNLLSHQNLWFILDSDQGVTLRDSHDRG